MDLKKETFGLWQRIEPALASLHTRISSKKMDKPKEVVAEAGPERDKKKSATSEFGKGVLELLQEEDVKKKALLFLVGIIGAILASYFLVLSPVSADIDRLEGKQRKLKAFRNELVQLKGDLDVQQALMGPLKKELRRAEAMFITEDELDSFYKSVSESASNSGLKIMSFEKMAPSPVYSESVGKKRKKTELLYLKTPVRMKVTGGYMAYLKFREDLAKSEKVVNTQSENIALSSSKLGDVVVTDIFYTYSVPSEKN
jgi:Tfp pilus assembly protein PilO